MNKIKKQSEAEARWKTNNAAEKGTNLIPLPRYGVVEGLNPPMLSFIQWFMLLFVPTKQMFPRFSLESCMEPHWRHCHVAMEMLPWHCPLVKETHMIGKERRRGGGANAATVFGFNFYSGSYGAIKTFLPPKICCCLRKYKRNASKWMPGFDEVVFYHTACVMSLA